MDERRMAPRYPIVIEVRFHWLDGSVKTMTVDLSAKGCRILTADPQGVERGGFVILSFDIPGHAEPVLVNPARVRWIGPDSVGVEFLCSKEEDQRKLQTFIEHFERAEKGAKNS